MADEMRRPAGNRSGAADAIGKISTANDSVYASGASTLTGAIRAAKSNRAAVAHNSTTFVQRCAARADAKAAARLAERDRRRDLRAAEICMPCGAPLPGGGRCDGCGVIPDLEAAATCATCATLSRDRLEWSALELGEAIAASNTDAVVLDRGLAIAMHRHLLDAKVEAGERIEVEHDLALSGGRPTKPRKESDRHAPHVQETVESEAIPASILRDPLRTEIESLLPVGAIRAARFAEESERQQLKRWADLMAGGRP